MRTRFFFLAASVTSLAAAAVAQGCGETETTSSPADGGTEAATTNDSGKKDTGPITEDAEPPCDTTHDFTKDIPDAEIADGATTTGICMGCTNQHCKKYIDDCTKNCECQGIAADALECYAKAGGDILKCIGEFPTNVSTQTKSTGFALFTCMNENCKDECATEELTDAGPKDASDGG